MMQNCLDTSVQSDGAGRALLWGSLGVLGFSFTLPATRFAVAQLDGTVVGLGRALVAAAVASLALAATRQRLPSRRQWPRLAVTALGVVVGFPLFSAWALSRVPAAHGAVIAGLLPTATAAMAVVRSGERPTATFWLASFAGLVAVLVFAVAAGAGRPQRADGFLLIAVLLCGLGYAEGGTLARELGGWQVISWALVLSAPLLLPIVLWRVRVAGLSADLSAWLCFAYVSLVSMYGAFFAWYRALAQGGVAKIGQLHLAQPGADDVVVRALPRRARDLEHGARRRSGAWLGGVDPTRPHRSASSRKGVVPCACRSTRSTPLPTVCSRAIPRPSCRSSVGSPRR